MATPQTPSTNPLAENHIMGNKEENIDYELSVRKYKMQQLRNLYKFGYHEEIINADNINEVFPEIYDIVTEIQDINKKIQEIETENENLKLPSTHALKVWGGGIAVTSMGFAATVAGATFFLPVVVLAFGLIASSAAGLITAVIISDKGEKKLMAKKSSTSDLKISQSALFHKITDKIKRKFVFSDKILDVVHLKKILTPISKCYQHEFIDNILTNMSNGTKANQCSFSFERPTQSNSEVKSFSLPVYSNTIANILSDERISQELIFDSNNSWVDKQIIKYYQTYEFKNFKFYSIEGALKALLYEKIFSIDKNWSDQELSNISSCLKDIEYSHGPHVSVGIIQSIKNNSKHAKRILKALNENTETRETAVKPKHIRPASIPSEYKIKEFLDLCTIYSEEHLENSNLSNITDKIIGKISTIEKHFIDKLSAEDKQLFENLTTTDLPALMQNWKNLEMLKAGHSHKNNVIDCVLAIDEKLESIVHNLQKRETQDVKIVKHMYSQK